MKKAIKMTEDEDFDKKNIEHVKEMLTPTLEIFIDAMGGIVRKVTEGINTFIKSEMFSGMQKICRRLGEIAYEKLQEEIQEGNDEREDNIS